MRLSLRQCHADSFRATHTIMPIEFIQLIIFIIIGLFCWLSGYFIQRSGSRRSRLVDIPIWIVWLFGNPRGNKRVDIVETCFQILGLIWILGGALLLVLNTEIFSRPVVLEWASLFWILCTAILSIWGEYENRREYRLALESSFGFLSTEYGFKKDETHRGMVIYYSNHCRLRLRLFPWKFVIFTIEPMVRAETSNAKSSRHEIEFALIARCLGASSIEDNLIRFNVEEINVAIDKAARHLKTYCEPLLEGNFSRWAEIEECVREYNMRKI